MIEMTCPVCDYTQDVELAKWCSNDGDTVSHTCAQCYTDIEGELSITLEILEVRPSQ
jgi:hypothetical protein